MKVVVDVHGDRAAETRLERGIPDDERTPPDPRESEVVLRADAVVHASAALSRRFPAAPGRPGVVVGCLVAASRIPEDVEAERLRREGRERLGFGEGDRVVAYAGSLAPWQEIPRLLSIMARAMAEDSALRLLLVTPSPRGTEAALSKAGVRRARTHVVSPEADRVIETLLAADIGVLLRRPALANHLAFPTKVAEYLAAGLWILGSDAVEAVVSLLRQEPSLGRVVPWATEDAGWASSLRTDVPGTVVRADRRAFARARLSWAGGDGEYRRLYAALSRA